MITDENFKHRVYEHIDKYATANWVDSLYNLIITIILVYICLQFNTLLMVPIFALSLVRTFIVFHDTIHYSFFPNSTCNKLAGLLTGTIIFSPFHDWAIEHIKHHKDSNKLDVHQKAQTAPWTVDQYINSTWYQKLLYRLAYGKYSLYTINPFIYFFIVQRFYGNFLETILSGVYLYGLYTYLDSTQYLYVILSYWLAGIIGVVLFHAQHTFDGVYKAESLNWDFFLNGMYGSSMLTVPFYLKFFTYGIEYHHIHHLNSKVPGYNLKRCHDSANGLFDTVNMVSMAQLWASMKYSVYDLAKKSFSDVHSIN